jgi:hypothetical protein
MIVELSDKKESFYTQIGLKKKLRPYTAIDFRGLLQRRKSYRIGHYVKKYDTSQLTKEIANTINKKSMKNFQIIVNKNKQEDARLKLLNRLMEKDYNYEDCEWFDNFRKVKNHLDKIQKNTKFFKDKEIKKLDLTNVNSASSLKSAAASNPTYSSLNSLSNDEEDEINKVKNEDRFNRDVSATISNFRRLTYNSSSEIFPFPFPRSYTSIVSSLKSLNDEQMDSFLKKENLNENYMRARTASSTKRPSLVSNITRKPTRINFNLDKDFSFIKSTDDYTQNLIDEKSIRRPLSSKSFLNESVRKANILEKRARLLHAQNDRNYERDNRNTRYGEPFIPLNLARINLKIAL